MKRKYWVAVCLAALLLFSSCGGNPAAGPDTTPTEVTSSAFPGNADCRITLYENGKTLYKLVRPDEAPQSLINLFTAVTCTMRSSGIAFYDGDTDWVKAGTETEGICEVLLGHTSRPETAAVLAELGPEDYAVTTVGNKIVIAAHTEEKLTEAVQVFCTELLDFEPEENGVRIVLTGTRVSRTGSAMAVNRQGGLEKYTVVYPAGSEVGKQSAESLTQAIKKVYGTELKAVEDTAAKAGPEIVLGKTSRPICQKIQTGISPGQFILAEDGGDILILGETDLITQLAVERFISLYVGIGYSDTLAVKEGANMLYDTYTFDEDTSRSEGTDIRVMSFNILAEIWNDKPPIEGRDLSLMAVVSAYAPDVLGLQEVTDGWYSYLDQRIGSLYAIADRKNNNGETNYSPIAYNKETVALLEHGVQEYSQGNSSKLRLVSWGYFERKATGQRFVAVSTHWDLGSNPQFQEIHSKEMPVILQNLQQKYNCPVITTGDYNVRENSAYYATFLELSGYQDAKFAADRVLKKCKTTHSLGKTFDTAAAGNAIDHIFGSPQVKFLCYNIVTAPAAIATSDHCPIYADVKLN